MLRLAGYGFMAGALVGAVMGSMLQGDSGPAMIVGLGGLLGLVGAVFGGLIGLMATGERFEPVAIVRPIAP